MFDEEVCTYWSRPPYASLAETTDAVTWEIANGASWVILDAPRGDESDAVGRISLFRGRSQGVFEVGVVLARAVWGRGFAGDALTAAVGHGFTALGAHRIFADVDPDNTASLRLFERAGFVREGLLRHAWRTHLGLRDSVILARFPPEVAP
jgi:[ribosomal protein S5]-alanine N-acetyltransferase